jgi:hypothetical protein
MTFAVIVEEEKLNDQFFSRAVGDDVANGGCGIVRILVPPHFSHMVESFCLVSSQHLSAD